MWEYRGEVVKVVDGDTVDVVVDLGFRVTCYQRLRLLGVDTPERNEPGWAEATAFTKSLLPVGQKVYIRTEKADSFGRYLAELKAYTYPNEFVAQTVNESLLASGHAIPYTK